MDVPLEIVAPDDVGASVKEYAKAKILGVAHLTREPVLFARIKLNVEPDPARDRPAIVQAFLDVNGKPVRAHTAAHDLREAIDLVEERLDDQLQHLAERRRALRQRGPQAREAHEWRRGDAPTRRPPYFDRPADEREVVRRKTFALHALSHAEAVEEMDRLDYDFHLFVCAETDAPCLIARRADGKVSISSIGPLPARPDWLIAEPAPSHRAGQRGVRA